MRSPVGQSERSRNQGVDTLVSEKDRVAGGFGELLDTGRDVDGVTDQGELELACAADGAGDHHTGVDPDTDPKRAAKSLGDEAVNQHSRAHVKILGIEKRKQTTRVDIEYLDGERAGFPRQRACDPIARYLLIPESVATYYDSSVRNGATVRDRGALEQLMHRPIRDLLDRVEWFEHDDVLELSADGTLLIAQYVCPADPSPILERVMAEEGQSREYCKRGRQYDAIDGSGMTTSTPEWEYEWYRKRHRPVRELLRGWCGHRSVTFVERLTAAEAEVRRLDILVVTLVDMLRKHDTFGADIYERDHDENRIRPETIRPVIDRPPAPWELPVREVPVRRGRWW